MERYDYEYEMHEDVKQAVKEWLEAYPDKLEEVDGDLMALYDDIYDDLWLYDTVTGNGSGSYTFSSYTAAEYLVGNYDLLTDALEEFGYEELNLEHLSPEYFDVTIRCYLLGTVLSEVLSDMMDEKEGE